MDSKEFSEKLNTLGWNIYDCSLNLGRSEKAVLNYINGKRKIPKIVEGVLFYADKLKKERITSRNLARYIYKNRKKFSGDELPDHILNFIISEATKSI
jgi:hypothetical protein